jgi:hypothetical protein
MYELIQQTTPMQWLGIGVLFCAIVAILLAVVGGNSIDPAERKRDDEAQARDVTQPAPLNPHVSARNNWSKS